MWLQYLQYAGMAAATALVICIFIFWLDHIGLFDALGSVYESLIEKPGPWSAAVFAVLALLALLRLIGAPTVLVATFAVYGGLRLLERLDDEYGCRILSALKQPRVRIYLALGAVVAVGAGAYWFSLPAKEHAVAPDVRRAEQRYQLLKESWARIQGSRNEFEQQLAAVHLAHRKDTYTLPEIHELNADLQKHAGNLLVGLEALVGHIEAYQVAAADAGAVYRRAATTLRDYATAERRGNGYQEFAETYREKAALWDAIATKHEQRERKLLKLQEMREIVRYLRRAQLMFARCGGLDIGEGLELAEQQRQLEVSLAAFVAKFDELRRAVREVTEQLNSQPPEDANPPDKPVDQRLPDPNTMNADDQIASHIPPSGVSVAEQSPRPAADVTHETRPATPSDASPSTPARAPMRRRGSPPTPSTSPEPVESTPDPFPKFNFGPLKIVPATAQPSTAVARDLTPVTHRDTGMPWDNADRQTERRRTASATTTATSRQSTTPQNLWTPRAGQVLVGTSYQVSDGGVNAANNNALLNRELKINVVSADGKRFSGVVTYTTYHVGGRTRYWGASAEAHGAIEGDRVTLVVDRAIYVPAGTFLSPGSCSGRIANSQVRGGWRAQNGAYGEFEFSLPR